MHIYTETLVVFCHLPTGALPRENIINKDTKGTVTCTETLEGCVTVPDC